jgi:hypothetical protein
LHQILIYYWEIKLLVGLLQRLVLVEVLVALQAVVLAVLVALQWAVVPERVMQI